MNFLAHCLLGHPDAALMAGGFIGDFVKGPVSSFLPRPLQAGVRLHRRIDAVSNGLPGIAKSVRRLHPNLRRVAPVLIDIVADHCLATAWERHGHDELPAFSQRAYAAIDHWQRHLPQHGKRFFAHVRDIDLFTRYREPEAARRGMAHVLERLRCGHLAMHLDDILSDGLPALAEDFDGYFPALKDAVAEWKEETGYRNEPPQA